MKRFAIAILVVFSVVTINGCRREDFREMTVIMETLKESDKLKIVEALSKYSGIDHGSYRWDMAEKSLTLRYDSMKIAQSNVRYAIDEKVVKVIFPKKTTSRAGY